MPLPCPDDATAWLRFVLRPGVGPQAQRLLLRHFGSPHAANASSRGEVAAVCGATIAAAFARAPLHELVERTLRWLEHPQHHLLALGDDTYPAMLLEIADPPTVLYAWGNLARLATPAIAIVGSRNATPRGLQDAQSLARALSLGGFCIVSGMAHGIDAAAHRGGLQGPGSTVAVLGTGVDRVYPTGHEELAADIASRGCLVSELPLGMHPDTGNFPRRNRLISGLARGVVVVEAAPRSGSLITARCAIDQDRDVFAVPGSIHSPLSKGCHGLIKRGAKLVESAADVMEDYGFTPAPAAGGAAAARVEAHPLLHAMGFSPVCVDELVALTGLAAAEVAAQLATLEIEGRVKPLGGGRFQRQRGRADAAL